MGMFESIKESIEEGQREVEEKTLLHDLKNEMEDDVESKIEDEVSRIENIKVDVDECISEFSSARFGIEEYCEGKAGEQALETGTNRQREAEHLNNHVVQAVNSCEVGGGWFW